VWRTLLSFEEMPTVCLYGWNKEYEPQFKLGESHTLYVQDLGLGVAMWMKMNQTQKTDVYFVFSDLIVTDKKKHTSCSGILVKLWMDG